MNTPKWIPKHSVDVLVLFAETRQLERDMRVLAKKFATNLNVSLPDYYEFGQLLSQSGERFKHSERLQGQLAKLAAISADQRIERSPYKVLQSRRATLCRQNVKRRHCQLIFVIHKLIRQMLNSPVHSDASIDSALVLCTLHNGSAQATRSNSTGATVSGAYVCSNSYPNLMLPPRTIDLHQILQTISKQRAELCCLALISCLLSSCAPELDGGCGNGRLDGGNVDDTSDTSSVEVLRALTVHLSSPPPTQDLLATGADQQHSSPSAAFGRPGVVQHDANDPTIDFFDTFIVKKSNNLVAPSRPSAKPMATTAPPEPATSTELLDHLVANEENFVANILLKCLKLCPSAFEGRPTKADIIKWVNRGTHSLWTQVGSTLEHVVLWWSQAPLACRPATSARHLRDWLLQLQQTDAPEPLLSTLRGLGETLTVYVVGTVWDRQFRLSLVASALAVQHVHPDGSEFGGSIVNEFTGTTTGRLWSELLHSLTLIANSCDCNGTIPNELPIVEQIPVLHRLDHSVHTMRLWSLAQATALCSDWNMQRFFCVAHTDVNQCLDQLHSLRVPELARSEATEVLVQVSVALRAKLVSEVRVNIGKLKQTYNECIEVLATICRTISLATLSLCFPAPLEWQATYLQDGANDYVNYYLNEIYLPVVRATKILDILQLVLRIMCESWLDHIYMKRIKFSRCGAMNLQCDFDGVATWIGACQAVRPEHRALLAKHEVLRTCEGVAKILLRKPDDVISMVQSRLHLAVKGSCEPDEPAQLPPEMFVPNQQRWLELRARNRKLLNYVVCNCATASSAD